MIYPSFPKKGDVLGICAPSAGVGHKPEEFDLAVKNLKKAGYRVKETASVRVDGIRSAEASKRADELAELFADDSVNTIMAATGGDFLYEILPCCDWDLFAQHPKWVWGASDPTSLLFPLTMKYDIATIYGMNAGSFDVSSRFRFVRDSLRILGGEAVVQKSFSHIDSHAPYADVPLELGKPARWQSNVLSAEISGRCVGGCIDVLKDLIGTPYDAVTSFIRRYRRDGLIWFFDNYALSAESFYRTLLQMKYAGWFEHANGIIIGRHCFPSSDTGMTYEEALSRVFSDIPVFYEADIGHTKPCLTMICGALLDLTYEDGRAELKFLCE